MISPVVLERLRPHGLVDLALAAGGLETVRHALLSRGWSGRNVERVLEEPAAAALPVPSQASRVSRSTKPRRARKASAEWRPAQAVRRGEEPARVRLDVVDVGALSSREQRFRCLPYSAVLSAGACLDRQARSAEATRAFPRGRPAEGARGEAVRSRELGLQYGRCVNCALGRSVATKV